MPITVALLEQILRLGLITFAIVSAATGLAILLFRVPARATVIEDGYRQARGERNAATFMTERAPMPFTVEGFVSFATRDGEELRTCLRRWASPAEPPSLVWYSPSDPRRVTGISPLRCFAWSLAGLASLAWLCW